MKTFKEFYTEGLWANINAKKKRGAKSARKGSKAYKAAKSAGNKLRVSKENEESPSEEDAESSPGRVKRAGASCKGTVTELRKRAKRYGGEKGRMYHWCANMKGGKKKSENEESTSKSPKGKSYDSQNNWKPSNVDAKRDGAGGRYRRTRPNKQGRSRKTHGEEDAEKKVSKTRTKCQAKAKRKYDVWPSAYASGYVQKCVNRGGNIK